MGFLNELFTPLPDESEPEVVKREDLEMSSKEILALANVCNAARSAGYDTKATVIDDKLVFNFSNDLVSFQASGSFDCVNELRVPDGATLGSTVAEFTEKYDIDREVIKLQRKELDNGALTPDKVDKIKNEVEATAKSLHSLENMLRSKVK